MLRLIASLTFVLLLPPVAHAGPWVDPGDLRVRNDIRLLADTGVLSGIVNTWPIPWADLLGELQAAGSKPLDPAQQAAVARLRSRLRDAQSRVQARAHLAAAENPQPIRTFEDQPRESLELGATFSWTGDRFAARLAGTWVDDPEDGKSWRPDGSYLAMVLGNWSFSAGYQERYWGPGWQSSMIYSNNARPIPSVAIDRMATTPFDTRWLAWLGPWDLSVVFGYLDDDRAIPDAQLFTARFSFRPLTSLEIGLTGMGLWCGEDQGCGIDDFADMLLGGGSGIDEDGEPNDFDRLSSLDVRWTSHLLGRPFALYTHIVGEDFGDGSSREFLPSALFGQFGAETWGYSERFGSYRYYLEWVETECDGSLFNRIDPRAGNGRPGCAYRNSLYQSGQTYRGRSFGHSIDQDSSITSLGMMLTDQQGAAWQATVSAGTINRRGRNQNTVATNQTDYLELSIGHRRDLRLGELHVGLGYAWFDDAVTGREQDDLRSFLEWKLPVYTRD